MKDKNLPDDIKAKSLDELREILNSLLTKIETSPNLENSAAVSYTHLRAHET